MSEVWICLSCKQPGVEPRTPLLDGSYGSDRCHSLFCKNERRIFHKEVNNDGNDDRNSGPRSPRTQH